MQTLVESRRTAVPIITAGIAAAAAAGLYFVNPNTTHVPLCPLHAATGLNCPLCGATRSAYALLHGQFGVALHDNAIFVLGLPLLALVWWRWRQREPGRQILAPWQLGTILAIGLIFGVLRNLPIGAGLAPPA